MFLNWPLDFRSGNSFLLRLTNGLKEPLKLVTQVSGVLLWQRNGSVWPWTVFGFQTASYQIWEKRSVCTHTQTRNSTHEFFLSVGQGASTDLVMDSFNTNSGWKAGIYIYIYTNIWTDRGKLRKGRRMPVNVCEVLYGRMRIINQDSDAQADDKLSFCLSKSSALRAAGMLLFSWSYFFSVLDSSIGLPSPALSPSSPWRVTIIQHNNSFILFVITPRGRMIGSYEAWFQLVLVILSLIYINLRCRNCALYLWSVDTVTLSLIINERLKCSHRCPSASRSSERTRRWTNQFDPPTSCALFLCPREWAFHILNI